MPNLSLSRTLRGVIATLALCTASVLAVALPSGKTVHTYKDGETLFSIARKYHVSVQQLVDANDFKNPDSIRNNTKIVIPHPHKKQKATTHHEEPSSKKRHESHTETTKKVKKIKHVATKETMHRRATIKGDEVSVRVGPDTERDLLTRLDKGKSVTVTAKRDGWAQIALANGKSGWVRMDFLSVASPKKVQKEASHSEKTQAKKVAKSSEAKRTAKKLAAKKATEKLTKLAKAEQQRKLKLKKAETEKVAVKTSKPAKHLKRKAVQVAEIAKPEYDEESASKNTAIVRSGLSFRGTPYRWGGASRGGFDCSGFTAYLYSQRGISLPHSARSQFTYGHAVTKSELKEGDLVFFHTVTPGISHVGMYIGDGRFVHASSRRSGGVRTDTLNSGYYSQRLVGARRISR